jgi:SAM-dependent methyltransferase
MPNAEPWYQNFFTGLIVEFQRGFGSEEQTRTEADFLEKELALPKGARIADVPCGNGRLSLALAARGYTVTGVDFCEGLLGDAKKGALDRKLPANFELRDMRDLPWKQSFDGAFCFGNSFAYFDDAGNLAYLKAIHNILKPGGRFVLETRLVAEGVFTQTQPRRWYQLGDIFFLHETRYDPPTARQISGYTLIKNGQVEKKEAVYRVYTNRQLAELFAEAGFSNLQMFGGLQREPFQLGSPGMWVVATA